MEKNADSHSLKCSPLAGCITPRKVAETSTQLHGLRNIMASLSLFVIERHSASDSSKSSIKIAYPERNGMGKTPMVTV